MAATAMSQAENSSPIELQRLTVSQASLDSLDGLTVDARALWAVSHDALAVVDETRRYLRVNGGTIELLGGSAQRVLRRRIDDFTPREQWPRLVRLWAELRRRGAVRGDYEVLQDDGSRVRIEYSALYNFRPGEHLIAARPVAPRDELARADSSAGLAVARPRLTRRETEILQLASHGRASPEIAKLLFVSESTIKTHFERIYQKLGASNRVAAVATALRLQIIT